MAEDCLAWVCFGKVGRLLATLVAKRGLAVEKLDAYLTIKEAASFLGVSPNTLRNWGRDGRIPMHRNPANGYRLFRRSDLEKFLHETAKPSNEIRKAK